MTPLLHQGSATKRRYRYTDVVGETKRAWLVKIPSWDKIVRIPKLYVDFEEVEGQKFFWISHDVAEFVGLIEEIKL